MKHQCSNYPCEHPVSKPGEVCHDCERKAKRMKAQDWNRRTSDYARAYAMWQKLYPVMICFLVRWECDGVFTVLEPSR
jgi:hypothetical protein